MIVAHKASRAANFAAPPADAAREKSLQEQMARQAAQQDYAAYMASLRAEAKIEINKANLEKKGG